MGLSICQILVYWRTIGINLMKKHFIKFIFISIICIFSIANISFASGTTLVADKAIYAPYENIRLFIYLKKPFEESMNAFMYNVSFDPEQIEYYGFESLGSISPIWVEMPKAVGESIHFSGIFPRGMKGVINPETTTFEDPILVTLLFKPKIIGKTIISLGAAVIYKDDGAGSPVLMPSEKVNITIVPKDPLVSEENKNIYDYDKNPPLDFIASIIQESNINNSKYSLIFNTTDLESGINHYEVKEGSSNFAQAESPYLIKDQSLTQGIIVRAYDNAGNFKESVVKVTSESNFSWLYLVLIGLAVLIIRVIQMIIKKEKKREISVIDTMIKKNLNKK